MASSQPLPPSSSINIPYTQAAPLLTSFTTFLTLCFHTLLFHRGLYPKETFTTVRAYNLTVHQSRHPGVCTWINDAIAAITAQLRDAAVKRVLFVVHANAEKKYEVVERWVFDVSSFPAWGRDEGAGGGGEEYAGGGGGTGEEVDEGLGGGDGGGDAAVNMADVNEVLRGALARLASRAEGMADVQKDCTFTVAVELRDEAEVPVEHPQQWVPTERDTGKNTTNGGRLEESKAPAHTLPVRSVRAGPLFFECWVEHGKTKGEASQAKSLPARRAKASKS